MNEKTHLFKAGPEDAGLRLDQFLAKKNPDYSRAFLSNQIKLARVRIDTEITLKAKTLIKGTEHIELTIQASDPLNNEPDPSVAFPIVFEDEALLIINKPAGLVVHPGAGNPDKTLLNGILSHCPGNKTLPRAGLIHRLDKDTSGLLMVAKTQCAQTSLVKALEIRQISRHYLALANGADIGSGRIESFMGRHPKNRLKMAVTQSGKVAITHFSPKEHFSHHTLLDVALETGRTHQIRVHLSHLKHPLVGDALYGGYQFKKKCFSTPLQRALESFKRQALHAYKLTLNHPLTKKDVAFEAPLPEDMNILLEELRVNDDMHQG